MNNPRSVGTIVLSALVAITLAGCSSSAPTQTQAELSDPLGSPEMFGQIPTNDSEMDETQRRLALMEQALQGTPPPDAGSTDSVAPPPVESEPTKGRALADLSTPIDLGDTKVANGQPNVVMAKPIGSTPPSPSEPSLSRSERITKHVHELAALIREGGEEASFGIPAWVRIAVLEAIEPGVLNAHYVGDGDGAGVSSLSESEHQFITAWRDLHTAVWENAESGDIARLAALVADAAEQMEELLPLRIAESRLCDRVERFGVYSERRHYDGTHKLLAGRSQRLLVYLEIDNYAHRETHEDGAEGHSVDLTVGLSLYHLGRETDLLAWRMADEAVSVFSRNKRREFFLSIIADLPETLTVDSYNLKAHVTDENSGSVTEAIIRIDIVADPSAFTASVD